MRSALARPWNVQVQNGGKYDKKQSEKSTRNGDDKWIHHAAVGRWGGADDDCDDMVKQGGKGVSAATASITLISACITRNTAHTANS